MTNFSLETSGDSMVSVSRIFFRKVIHSLALDRLIGLRATPKYRAGETKYSGHICGRGRHQWLKQTQTNYHRLRRRSRSRNQYLSLFTIKITNVQIFAAVEIYTLDNINYFYD